MIPRRSRHDAAYLFSFGKVADGVRRTAELEASCLLSVLHFQEDFDPCPAGKPWGANQGGVHNHIADAPARLVYVGQLYQGYDTPYVAKDLLERGWW
ncbi:hypothetical protein BQ8482_130023 [Mesorhizobium delmotii]|uniref:Uncharacterized protein n=1 Tax=Mesorhizobium delmotii TaxID=1631247 RepID=A0A2P9AG83_9HYPH|nr:hypothetical protein BQ8482_130023 [Mesorhizobium delmotii]